MTMTIEYNCYNVPHFTPYFVLQYCRLLPLNQSLCEKYLHVFWVVGMNNVSNEQI